MGTAPVFRAHDSMEEDRHPVVRLRPHHLLCLQNFRGNGYSPAFIEKMTEVSGLLGLRSVSSEASTEKQDSGPGKSLSDVCCILLTEGSDDLCLCCPNCIEGRCSSEKPALFDELVLQASGYEYGRLPAGWPQNADFPPMSPELLRTCCPGCQWFSLCMEICSASHYKQKAPGPARP